MSAYSSAAAQFLATATDKPSDRTSFETAPTAGSSLALMDEEESANDYWNDDDWVPLNKNGTQRTPNQIRGELQRYLDKCGMTQGSVLTRMGVSSNSFRRFMDPANYKNMWSAVENGTYWAAAKMLEEERMKPKPKATASAKRKAADMTGSGTAKKSKTQAKAEVIELMQRIMAVEGTSAVVYDSCPEVVKKIKAFLAMDGVTKSDFCAFALGGLQTVQLNRFLLAKHQDGAGMVAYERAYTFFEKKRVLEGAPKSKARIKNEADLPAGFSLSKPRNWIYVFAK